MITADDVTLKPRLYKDGRKMTGCRLVFIGGEHWANVEMVGHGCHGPSYEFYHASTIGRADPVTEIDENTKPDSRYRHRHVKVHTPHLRIERKAFDSQKAIRERVAEIVNSGALKSPAEKNAEYAKQNEAYDRERAEALAKSARMEAGLVAAFVSPGLSDDERQGIRDAFKELCHRDIAGP